MSSEIEQVSLVHQEEPPALIIEIRTEEVMGQLGFDTPGDVYGFAMELIKAVDVVWGNSEFVREHRIKG